MRLAQPLLLTHLRVVWLPESQVRNQTYSVWIEISQDNSKR